MAINQDFRSEQGFVVGDANVVVSGIIPITTVFTSNSTYTKNSNLVWAEIIVVGAGGSSLTSSHTGNQKSSAGGSGAGTAIKRLSKASIRATELAVVGISSGNSSGTNSSFGNSTSTFTKIVATGGQVPANIGNSSVFSVSGDGGTGIAGDINIPGGEADSSDVPSSSSSRCSGGRGGDTPYGFGGGSSAANGASSEDGNPGTGYGSGGGGSAVGASAGSDAQTGLGANGVVIITEYCHT